MDCEKCKRNPARKCKKCGCRKCSGKYDKDSIIMCDECNNGYHLECLGLTVLPQEDEWFCPECKNEDTTISTGARPWPRGKGSRGPAILM